MKLSNKQARIGTLVTALLFTLSCASYEQIGMVKKTVAEPTKSVAKPYVPVPSSPIQPVATATGKPQKPFTVKFKDTEREPIEDEEGPRENLFSLHFRKIGLEQVISMLSDRGRNFRYIIHPDVGDRRVLGLVLENVTWREALETMLKLHNLIMQDEHGLLVINTYENFMQDQERLAARVKLRQERTDMERSILTSSLESSKMTAQKARTFRTFHLKYTQPEEVKTYLESIFINAAQVTTGGGQTGVAQAPINLAGRNIAFSTFSKASLLTAFGTPHQLIEVGKRIDEIDQPQKQIFIESRIVEIMRNYSKSLGIQWGGNAVAAGANVTSAAGTVDYPAVDPSGLGTVAAALNISVANAIGTRALNMRLTALEQEGKSKTLANPKITTINGVMARIESGREIPYLTSAEGGGTTVEFKQAVISLEVTPFITPNDMVNMKILAKKDDADFTNSVGGTPSILTRQIETTVLVASGGTAVLGGVFENVETDTEIRTPALSRIPIIGWLFKNKSNLDNEKELLIFISPLIVRGNFS